MEARQKLQPSHLQCQGAASVCLIMLCLVFQSWHQQQPKWGPPFHHIMVSHDSDLLLLLLLVFGEQTHGCDFGKQSR